MPFPDNEELEKLAYREFGKCLRIDIGIKEDLLRRHRELCPEDFED